VEQQPALSNRLPLLPSSMGWCARLRSTRPCVRHDAGQPIIQNSRCVPRIADADTQTDKSDDDGEVKLKDVAPTASDPGENIFDCDPYSLLARLQEIGGTKLTTQGRPLPKCDPGVNTHLDELESCHDRHADWLLS